MKLNHFYYLLILIISCLTSCNEDKLRSENTYLNATIVNPNSKFIMLLDFNNKIMDTFFLDNKGHFKHQFKNFKTGLYTIYDSREAQSIFIEKGDSLTFRLNTIDFDESLVYTGIGSRENNYLMDLFLENENQENTFLKYSQLPSILFIKKVDSIKEEKLKKLKKFSKKNKTSPTFNEVAQGNIVYHNYYSKEFYPFARLDKDETTVLNQLDDSFYCYRKEIDYNSKLLQNYFPYKSFLRFHFNNLALKDHFKHSKDSIYNSTSLHYNLDRFKLIDEKVSFQNIKNDLSYYYMFRYLNDAKNVEDFETVFNAFTKINTNKDQIKKAGAIVKTYTRLKPGYKLPNVAVINKNNEIIPLSSLITKPTVLYFWTINNKYHLIDAHKKAAELSKRYPEYRFITINTDAISSKTQVKVIARNQLDYVNEFRFKHPEKAKKLLAIKPINNVFLLDKKMKIINPKANMFSVDFEQQLVELLNQ